jgi:hypothetical protein
MVRGASGPTGVHVRHRHVYKVERTGRGRVRDRPRTTAGRIVRGTPSRNDHVALPVLVRLHMHFTIIVLMFVDTLIHDNKNT